MGGGPFIAGTISDDRARRAARAALSYQCAVVMLKFVVPLLIIAVTPVP